jgi:hypothetical protein
MLKIIIGSLFTKNTKYAVAEKINGSIGEYFDGYNLYQD